MEISCRQLCELLMKLESYCIVSTIEETIRVLYEDGTGAKFYEGEWHMIDESEVSDK